MITEENISSIIFRDTKAVVDFYYKDETFKVSIASDYSHRQTLTGYGRGF